MGLVAKEPPIKDTLLIVLLADRFESNQVAIRLNLNAPWRFVVYRLFAGCEKCTDQPGGASKTWYTFLITQGANLMAWTPKHDPAKYVYIISYNISEGICCQLNICILPVTQMTNQNCFFITEPFVPTKQHSKDWAKRSTVAAWRCKWTGLGLSGSMMGWHVG